MIHLRKLRSFTPRGEEKKTSDVSLNISVENLAELFTNLLTYIEKIPEQERFNCFYTLGHGDNNARRDWKKQDVIAIDIDGIDKSLDKNLYIKAFAETLPGLDIQKTAIVSSGNGLHFIFMLQVPILEKKFFTKYKTHYKEILTKLEKNFQKYNLPGKGDPAVFAPNFILRLPGTKNIKEGKEEAWCELLLKNLEPQDINLAKLSGLPEVDDKSEVSKKHLERYAIDTKAVEEGCNFLKFCREEPESVSEPQWYAMLSVVSRLKDGAKKCHEYSSLHHKYSAHETNQKIEHSLNASGPRTCENINNLWGACSGCKNFEKVTSPINIISKDFIATEFTGFHKLGPKDQLVPHFEDLRKYFQRQYNHKVDDKTGVVYTHNGTHFEVFSHLSIRNFADIHFNPKPRDQTAAEFVRWVDRINLIPNQWFQDSARGKINFANGVLDIKTWEMKPHSPDYGFFYVLPYEYSPLSDCPTFKTFLHNVTCGDEDLQKILLQFVGYALCDQDYWLQKVLVLVGEGSNGKTTFIDIVRALAGEKNCSSLSLSDLQKENNRLQMEGKLLNLSDELPNYNFTQTEMLKKLTGGRMTTKRLYHDAGEVQNTAKFIFAGNEIPKTTDHSHGFFRRLIIVPFDARFDKSANNLDKDIKKKMLRELPGIFNLVLKNYLELCEHGEVHNADRSTMELKDYRGTIDVNGTWIDDNLTTATQEDYLVPRLIYDKYASDMLTQGEKRWLTLTDFIGRLKKKIPNFQEKYRRVRVGKERLFVIHGIKYKNENETEEEPF